MPPESSLISHVIHAQDIAHPYQANHWEIAPQTQQLIDQRPSAFQATPSLSHLWPQLQLRHLLPVPSCLPSGAVNFPHDGFWDLEMNPPVGPPRMRDQRAFAH